MNIENPLIIAVNNTRIIPLFFIRIFKVGGFKKIMVTVYCLGNKYIKKDSLALKFVDREINGMKFVEYDQNVEGDIWIMDVCMHLHEMKLLDLEAFLVKQPLSMHDFDIGTELKLLQAVGQIGKVNVIAIPMEFTYDQVLSNLNSKKWVEQDIQGS